MTKQTTFFLALFTIPCYSAPIYQGIDENGNLIFADQRLPTMQRIEQIELSQLTPAEEHQQAVKVKQLADEANAIRKRLDKKQSQRNQVQKKIESAYAKVQAAQKAMIDAEKNWQERPRTAHSKSSQGRKKQALLEAAYKKAKANYVKTQQELAKAQSERNSLR